MMRRFSLIVLTILLLSSLLPVATVAEERVPLKRLTVVIDAAHGPAINVSLLASTLKNICHKISLSHGINITVEVFERGSLNKTLLSVADVWVIPPLNGSIVYSPSETKMLKWYLDSGGALVVMSAACVSYNPHPDPVVVNSLLMDLGVEDVKFFINEGYGDTLYDFVHGQGNGSVLVLNDSLATRGLSNFFDVLIVRSAGVEVQPSVRGAEVIRAPPTVVSVNVNFSVAYGNFSVFAWLNVSNGQLVVIGFGEIYTNATSPLGLPWMCLGDNLKFTLALFERLLKPERWVIRRPARFPAPLHTVFIGIGVVLVVVSVIPTRRAPRR